MKWIHLTVRRNSKHINSSCFEPITNGNAQFLQLSEEVTEAFRV
jgi:hypothetical protein